MELALKTRGVGAGERRERSVRLVDPVGLDGFEAAYWIYETLQRDDDGRIAEEYFLDALRPELGDLAAQQLDTATDWGRYAEPFAPNDDWA